MRMELRYIFLFGAALLIMLVLAGTRYENYRYIKTGNFSEKNKSCQTGHNALCRMESGKGGLCDWKSGRCIDPDPRSMEDYRFPGRQTYHEYDWQCTQPTMTTCMLSNGRSGVCGLSGTCMPASHMAY